MKEFISKHATILFISFALFIWRIFLFVIEQNIFLLQTKATYLGPLFQANFDGVYYVAISQFWYRGLDQAFFPLYPAVIYLATWLTGLHPATAGLIVSVVSLFFLLKFFSLLQVADGFKKSVFWSIILYLSFPSAFFFGAVYTESLFICLTLLSFYLARKNKHFLSSLVASFATATRIVGIFLLPALALEFYEQLRVKKKKISKKLLIRHFSPLLLVPLGLVSYMGYLWYQYHDPLLFVHIQPAFGAGRSGGAIILLPQVLFRYAKILLSARTTDLTFYVAILELSTPVIVSLLLYLAYKSGVRKSYILFSACALLFPTLSGTLSSLPRYALVCFPIFIFLAQIKNQYVKALLILSGLILEGILALYFLNGYFIS
ncbi:MAG: hypothetical protein ACM3IJ_02715 [Candidatus Levyibacteriota bacterium]